MAIVFDELLCWNCGTMLRCEGKEIPDICDECGKIVKKLVCNRCTYAWHPLSRRMPGSCPNCKSPYWASRRTKAIWPENMANRVKS